MTWASWVHWALSSSLYKLIISLSSFFSKLSLTDFKTLINRRFSLLELLHFKHVKLEARLFSISEYRESFMFSKAFRLYGVEQWLDFPEFTLMVSNRSCLIKNWLDDPSSGFKQIGLWFRFWAFFFLYFVYLLGKYDFSLSMFKNTLDDLLNLATESVFISSLNRRFCSIFFKVWPSEKKWSYLHKSRKYLTS